MIELLPLFNRLTCHFRWKRAETCSLTAKKRMKLHATGMAAWKSQIEASSGHKRARPDERQRFGDAVQWDSRYGDIHGQLPRHHAYFASGAWPMPFAEQAQSIASYAGMPVACAGIASYAIGKGMYPMPQHSGLAASTLGITSSLPPDIAAAPPLKALVEADRSFKVKLCRHWPKQAGCSRGVHCSFAHGECCTI